jgi:hypothetical protein
VPNILYKYYYKSEEGQKATEGRLSALIRNTVIRNM